MLKFVKSNNIDIIIFIFFYIYFYLMCFLKKSISKIDIVKKIIN